LFNPVHNSLFIIKEKIVRLFIMLFIMGCTSFAHSALTEIMQERLVDSENDYDRRIYSYDLDVDSSGIVHAVYSKPVPGEDRAEIIYTRKNQGEAWPAESSRLVLEEFGLLRSISTQIIIDENNVAHINYVVKRSFITSSGNEASQGLVYQTVSNNVAGEKINVSPGGFHSKMQLNAENKPIFIREYENFLNADGSLADTPFPKALRIQLPKDNNTWTDRDYILQLPEAEGYRIADFLYDKENDRYHVSYGDKDADSLRETYPTTHPGSNANANANANAVFFPPGAGHRLVYAQSSDLINWTTSFIDESGNLSENELWTDLGVDLNAEVYAGVYRYKTDSEGFQQGSTNIFARQQNGVWSQQTVAGKTTGASESRAGMGVKLLQDSDGGFHGVWDNSPDSPIDSEGERGTTMYRYSPDGTDWESRQQLFSTSTEGKVKAKIHDNKLFLMLLTDFVDANIVYAEYQLPAPDKELMEVSTDKMFYENGEAIQIYVRLEGQGTRQGDLYFVVHGPLDKLESGELVTNSNTQFSYLASDASWITLANVIDSQPVLSNFSVTDFHAFFMNATAHRSAPFDHPSRYVLYSLITQAGAPLTSGQFLSDLYRYELHVKQ
jgi:hypothetical protein